MAAAGGDRRSCRAGRVGGLRISNARAGAVSDSRLRGDPHDAQLNGMPDTLQLLQERCPHAHDGLQVSAGHVVAMTRLIRFLRTRRASQASVLSLRLLGALAKGRGCAARADSPSWRCLSDWSRLASIAQVPALAASLRLLVGPDRSPWCSSRRQPGGTTGGRSNGERLRKIR